MLALQMGIRQALGRGDKDTDDTKGSRDGSQAQSALSNRPVSPAVGNLIVNDDGPPLEVKRDLVASNETGVHSGLTPVEDVDKTEMTMQALDGTDVSPLAAVSLLSVSQGNILPLTSHVIVTSNHVMASSNHVLVPSPMSRSMTSANGGQKTSAPAMVQLQEKAGSKRAKF